MSIATHPGYTATNLQYYGSSINGKSIYYWILKVTTPWMGQSQEKGAWTQVCAAVDSQVVSGDYIGPHMKVWGYPQIVESNKASKNLEDAQRLWKESERLTGISFSI